MYWLTFFNEVLSAYSNLQKIKKSGRCKNVLEKSWPRNLNENFTDQNYLKKNHFGLVSEHCSFGNFFRTFEGPLGRPKDP